MFDEQLGNGWVVPIGYTADLHGASRCRSERCNAEILWCMTPAGKRAPLNRDGSNHFSTCPAASSFRKRK